MKSIAVEYGSVYLRNRPMLRAITNCEMMEVYDLEIPTQLDLESFWAQSKVKATRAFCSAAPAKLLRSAARAALLVSGSVTFLDLGVDNRASKTAPHDVKVDAFDPKAAPKHGYERDNPEAPGK